MVAGRGLFEPEHVLEVADADRFAAGSEQAVEDLDPVAVGERLEHTLEFVGLVVAEWGALSGAQHWITGSDVVMHEHRIENT